jgi:serine phosphatase RsbU (regulator of sigma subunit)/pSer/pThr/pTyr-binding forkhead associated (FHA) protein
MPLRFSVTLNGENQEWTLEKFPARLGRSSSNAIQLLDGTVSKEHAEIVGDGPRWMVRDLGSRNGTRVNGQDASSPLEIKPGDTLEIGHVLLRAVQDRPSNMQFIGGRGVDSSLKMKVADLLQAGPASASSMSRVVNVLAEAGQLLVMPRPLRETCEEMLRLVEKAVPAERFVMLLAEGPDHVLTQIAARTRGASASEPMVLSQTIIRTVLEENTALVTSDASSDPRLAMGHSVIMQAIRSAMAVPLWDNQRVLGLLYADSTKLGVRYEREHLEVLTLLANMAAVKITNAHLLEAEQARQRMAQELATASRIQRDLLPGPARDVPGWTCEARLEPCFEVGGDLYDFHRREDGALVIAVGDISGKGMGAALLMSSIMTTARVLYDASPNPLALVKDLNRVMHRSTDGGRFATLFVGFLDTTTGALQYVNAGHPEPYLVLGDRVRALESTGIPVAMLPTFPWTMGEVTIDPGETLVVFSDGIPEAQKGDDFFDNERIEVALKALLGAGADLPAAAAGLIAKVDAFTAGEHRGDDVTLVMLRRD